MTFRQPSALAAQACQIRKPLPGTKWTLDKVCKVTLPDFGALDCATLGRGSRLVRRYCRRAPATRHRVPARRTCEDEGRG